MRHSASKGAVSFGFFRIGVKPVVITGQVGELIYHCLGNLDLTTPGAKLLRDQLLHRFDIIIFVLFHYLLRLVAWTDFYGQPWYTQRRAQPIYWQPKELYHKRFITFHRLSVYNEKRQNSIS